MLILLFGPSGVGKSALIQHLVENWGWTAIPSYVTRSARPNEMHKVSVEEVLYRQWLAQDLLFSHVVQLGGMYGTMRKDIEAGVSSKAPFVLDFSLLEYKKFFSTTKNFPIVLLPESPEQLKTQLLLANRENRLEQAAYDLERFTGPLLSEILTAKYETIINRPHQLGEAVLQVATVVKRAASQL